MRACNYTELVSITMNGKAKEFSKERFYHYSNVTKIKSILENNEIWLTRLDSTNLNDLDEKDLKYNDPKKIYSVSFCNSNIDVLPMWLLYGGLEQQGCALAITQGGFRDWISSINVIRAFNFDSESKSYDKGVELSNDYFSVEYGWIRYKKGNRYRCRGKYAIQQTDESILQTDEIFIKREQWHYEKEFRLVIIMNDIMDYNRVAIPITNLKNNKKRVLLSPEITDKEAYRTEFELYGISKVDQSDLRCNFHLKDR